MTTNIPELPTLIQAARDIVTAARRENSLGSLTIKKVRRQLEQKYSLEEGKLDEGSTKTALRNAVNAALSEDAEPPITKKRKTSPSQSDEQEDVPPKKTRKPNKKPSAKDKHAALERSGSDGNVKGKLAEKRKKITTDSEDGKVGLNPKTTTSAEQSDVALPIKTIKREANEKEDTAANESGEVKPRKGKTKDSKKPSRKAKKEKHVDTLTADEKTIKRLKSLVSACGVRKSWSKEFSGLSLPAQQITRLREILANLGMKGRYSLEQAKAIRRRRELARELDDVVEFERKAGTSRSDGGRRQTSAKRAVAELDTNSEISESETEIKDNSKSTASKSIMAYLANQSSEEE